MTDEALNLMQDAPCGVFSFKDDGEIISANKFFLKIFEYSLDELPGLNLSRLLSISGKIFYQTHLFTLVKLHGNADEIFINFLSKSKKDIPVILNIIYEHRPEGSILICSFLPVFNRLIYEDEILLAKKAAEDALHKNIELERVKNELEEQYKALDKQITRLKFQNEELLQLNNIIAHDLQEPVRKIVLFSTELQNPLIEKKPKDNALNVIIRSAERIKNLLHHLQEYMALTHTTKSFEIINLSEIVNNELTQLTKNFPSVRVEHQFDHLPKVEGDSHQLKILFHQIFKNAFMHGRVDDTVSIRMETVIIKENLFNAPGDKYSYVDFIKITISDAGAGFDNKYNEYVFNVLKRLNINEGTLGFGLAFCNRIVINHNGHIKAEGMPGKGARITIMLPLNQFNA